MMTLLVARMPVEAATQVVADVVYFAVIWAAVATCGLALYGIYQTARGLKIDRDIHEMVFLGFLALIALLVLMIWIGR